jgi:hypothetical protein
LNEKSGRCVLAISGKYIKRKQYVQRADKLPKMSLESMESMVQTVVLVVETEFTIKTGDIEIKAGKYIYEVSCIQL